MEVQNFEQRQKASQQFGYQSSANMHRNGRFQSRVSVKENGREMFVGRGKGPKGGLGETRDNHNKMERPWTLLRRYGDPAQYISQKGHRQKSLQCRFQMPPVAAQSRSPGTGKHMVRAGSTENGSITKLLAPVACRSSRPLVAVVDTSMTDTRGQHSSGIHRL